MKEAVVKSGDSTESNLEWRKLRSLLRTFDTLVKEAPDTALGTSKRIRVFSQLDTKTYFLSLPVAFQKKAVDAFRFYVETFESMVKGGESPTNPKRFLWRAIQALDLVPMDNLFEYLSDDDIIEVYSSEGIQIFRSFSFLEPISYAIEDLIVFPWHDLFVRDETITQRLITQAIKLFGKEISCTQVNEIDFDHRIVEAKSPEKHSLNARFGIVSPVRNRAPSPITYFVTTFKMFERHQSSAYVAPPTLSP